MEFIALFGSLLLLGLGTTFVGAKRYRLGAAVLLSGAAAIVAASVGFHNSRLLFAAAAVYASLLGVIAAERSRVIGVILIAIGLNILFILGISRP